MLNNPDGQPGPGPEHTQFTQLNLGRDPAIEVPATVADTRQQNKIIAYLHSRDPEILLEHEIDVTTNERHDVLWALARGAIGAGEIRGLLLRIPTPADDDHAGREIGIHHVFNNLAFDQQLRGILSVFSREDFEQRNNVTPADVARFLSLYPDPSVFEAEIGLFLDRIEEENDSAKRTQYEAKMHIFLQ